MLYVAEGLRQDEICMRKALNSMKDIAEILSLYIYMYVRSWRKRQFSSANSVNFRGCVTLSRERRPTPDKKRESIRFANSSRTFVTIERT